MAVPVQTWGTLGSMVAEQKDFGSKTAEYLEAHEVYDLFGHLLRQVIVHQPNNPIKFLQEQLKKKPKLTVCVIGPPGINRSVYCQMIAKKFKVKHLKVGEMLAAKKELVPIIQSGALADDDIVVQCVKAATHKAESTGWVLDGFPRTKTQAQALSQKELGFSLDKVLLLHTGEKVIRQRFAAKVATKGVPSAEKEELINARLQQYQRHVISIAELFKNVLRQIEVGVGDDEQVIMETITSNLHYRGYSNAAMRPHRICIVGACASGRTTQSRTLAKHYGLVHVDVAALLRKKQKALGQPGTEIPPEYVSDEDLCSLVGARLNETDCLRKGWILDGFPKTQNQAEYLRQAHLWPSRVVQLKVTDEDVSTRAASRHLDPVTGAAYYNPPNNVAIRQRLVKAPHDEPDAVAERYRMHQDNVQDVLQAFPAVSFSVQGNADASTATKHVQQKVDEKLRIEEAQDPEGQED